MIIYLLNGIEEEHQIQEEVRNLLTKYPQVYVAAMGFPEDWEKEDIWQ